MAATIEARRLTEAHRLTQARLGAQTILRMRQLWPILDGEALDASFPLWLRSVTPLVRLQRVASARLAASYLGAFRTLELGLSADTTTPRLAETVVTDALTTSMLVTGPAAVKSATKRGVTIERAMTIAEAMSASAAMRHALNGGRDTIVNTVRADRTALGWARATSGSPCAFCAMLASRGPVYKTETTGGFQAHDHCSCAVEPVYRRDADWPAGGRRYQEIWNEAKLADGDTVANFRRLIEAA